MSKFNMDDFRYNFNDWKKRTANRIRNPRGVYPGGGFPIAATAMIVMGLLFILCPIIIAAAASMIIGITMCVFGVLAIVSYVRIKSQMPFGSFTLVRGIIMILIGAMFIVDPGSLIRTISFMMGFYFAFDGGIKFNRLMKFKQMHSASWWMKSILSAILCLGGIIIIVYPFTVINTLFLVCGVALIVSGIQKLFR